MYDEKGLIKVFNGAKYKTVSYRNKDGIVTFTTSNKSRKYQIISKEKKVRVLEKDSEKIYGCTLIEETELVDSLFNGLKEDKTIPFFIPRKGKIIVQFRIE